jgi:AraC-like DNA-binding protein
MRLSSKTPRPPLCFKHFFSEPIHHANEISYALRMIRFGSMSITLLLGALYGVLFAVLLWFTRTNTIANRFLALLLIAFVLRLVPFIIGYAGYYDAYPWLSFMPYNVSLAFGPLLYLHVRSLTVPTLPPRWLLHFLPVAIQFTYYCVVFAQPLAFKNSWNGSFHVPFVYPVELVATFISIGAYWWKSFVHHRAYQQWLVANVSQAEDNRIEWVRNFLLALAITLVLWIALDLVDRFVAKLNYFHRFPFYVWLGVLVYYLGTEGYRHSRHRYPVGDASAETSTPIAIEVAKEVEAISAPPPEAIREPINWQVRAEQWRQKIIDAEWWRDSELTLTTLARKLGTNTSDLSRAINEGLGMNFNELINRLRVDAVKAALAKDRERNLLDIAFDAGFSSKASFNRSFKLYTGATPTAWRAQQ